MPPWEGSLSELAWDALRELGNIGAGNATTALSQLLGERLIRMTSPTVALPTVAQLSEHLGPADQPVSVVFQKVSGDLAGEVAFLLPDPAAQAVLATMLGGLGVAFTPSDLPLAERSPEDLEASALLELGNIVLTSYLNALSELTSLRLSPSVPAAARDMLGAVVSSMLAEMDSDDRILVIEATLQDERTEVSGYLLFFPEEGQLNRLLEALGLAG